MRAGIAEAWPLVLAALAVLALALALLVVNSLRRARVRQRNALGETGLQLAFDACAPEGGIVSFEDFPAVHLRAESLASVDPRR